MDEQECMDESERAESDTSCSEDNYWMIDSVYASDENESGELTTDGEHEADNNGHKRLSKSEVIQIEEQIIAEIQRGDFNKELKKMRLEKAVQKIRKGSCVEREQTAANAIEGLSTETISLKPDLRTDKSGELSEKANETGLNATTNEENSDGSESMERP